MELTVIVVFALILVIAWHLSGEREDPVEVLKSQWGRPLVRERHLESVAQYHQWKATTEEAPLLLDDRTWADLDMDHVFAHVDRTQSTVGAQLLYHQMRTDQPADRLARFDRIVEHFAGDPEARISAQLLLSRLEHPDGYRLWQICRPDALVIPWWYYLFPVQALGAVACIVAAPFWPPLLLLLLAIIVINVGLQVRNTFRVLPLLGPFKQVAPLIRAANALLTDPEIAQGWDSREDLKAVRPLRTTASVASRHFGRNEVVATTWEYMNLLFLFDANAAFFATRTLRERGASLLRVLERVGTIDAAISVASLRADGGTWSKPTMDEGDTDPEWEDVWHPLVEDPVANSIGLTAGRGLIVTGSNMSGKSTFLRTLGVAVALSQTLGTVPARSYRGPRLAIGSAIGRADDILAGKSYYLAEVDAVLGLVRRSAESPIHLFLLDELFRGTNTVERVAAGQAVLRGLLGTAPGGQHHIAVAATHDRELVELLEDSYDSHSFSEQVHPDGLSFDYRLTPGTASTRNAIALLQIRGAPEDIVQSARDCARRLGSGTLPAAAAELT